MFFSGYQPRGYGHDGTSFSFYGKQIVVVSPEEEQVVLVDVPPVRGFSWSITGFSFVVETSCRHRCCHLFFKPIYFCFCLIFFFFSASLGLGVDCPASTHGWQCAVLASYRRNCKILLNTCNLSLSPPRSPFPFSFFFLFLLSGLLGIIIALRRRDAGEPQVRPIVLRVRTGALDSLLLKTVTS